MKVCFMTFLLPFSVNQLGLIFREPSCSLSSPIISFPFAFLLLQVCEWSDKREIFLHSSLILTRCVMCNGLYSFRNAWLGFNNTYDNTFNISKHFHFDRHNIALPELQPNKLSIFRTCE